MAEGAPPARGGSNPLPPLLKESPATARRKGPVEAQLTCRAGPRAGEDFPLEKDEYVIGRAVDADISIPDTSVSRRHARLARGESNWTIIDLNSGNGVLLNGERVDQETPVRHGDVLVLGDTELVFADLANSTDRAPMPVRPVRRTADRPSVRVRGTRLRPAAEDPKRRLRKRLLQVGLVLLALVGLGVLKTFKKKNEVQASVEAARERAAKHKGELFRAGGQLARAGNWDEARSKFLEVKAQDPNYPEIQDALEQANQEIPNQQALGEARTALESSHLTATAKALAKVNPNTLMFDQVARVKADLASKAAAQVELARQDLEAKKLQEAAALSADVLGAFPEDRDAKSINESASVVAPTGSRRGGGRVASASQSPAEEAARLFVGGDLTGAQEVATGCASKVPKCRLLQHQMSEFASLQKRVDELDARGLERLKALENDITGGRGSQLGHAAGIKQSGPLMKKATAAKAAGDLVHAAQFARQALKADGSNASARAMVDELRLEAKEVFRMAYGEQETDAADAIQKLHQVLAMTAPGDEYNVKAQKLIEKLKQ